MQYINIIYFIIITSYGYKFLKSDGMMIKGALDPENTYKYSGLELFWTLTFATGLLAFSADVGLDLTAIRLGVIELLLLIGLNKSIDKPIWSAPLKLYVLFLIWLLCGCFYGPSIGYGIRVILKYLYPLLICLFASAVVKDKEVFLKSSLLARTVAVISIALSFAHLIKYLCPGVFWYSTARAINYISLIVFSMGLFYFTTEKKKNLLYVVILILPCFIWVFRTSIMGSLVAIMAFMFIRYRLKSIPIILGIIIAGVASVFLIPSLHDKMFRDEASDVANIQSFKEGNISTENIDSNARFAMWEHLQELFYDDHQIIGSGTGAVQNYMYNNVVFGGLKVPHNDFVQIMCDNGLIALILYILISLSIFVHSYRIYWSTKHPVVKLAAITAGASMLGVFITLYSDNVVNYSMATLSMPYGFYGMTLGLKRHLQ